MTVSSVTDKIILKARQVVNICGTRDAEQIARWLGITVMRRPFTCQKGAYKVIEKNPFIFIKRNLHPILFKIVLLHEIGHDQIHREEAVRVGGFREYNIFAMQASMMEYEANLFASEVSLPTDEVLELVKYGRTIQQIAGELESELNLVAIKIDTLISQGYQFRSFEHSNNFLR
jgi:Zn-dependent peptidase ImmA (M78 family)